MGYITFSGIAMGSSGRSFRSNVNGIRETTIREASLAWCITTLTPISAWLKPSHRPTLAGTRIIPGQVYLDPLSLGLPWNASSAGNRMSSSPFPLPPN